MRAVALRNQGAPIDIIVPTDGVGFDLEATAIMRGTRNLAAGSNLALITSLGINPAGLSALATLGVTRNTTGLDFQLAVAGRYSIERELGRGGMGVVYLARDVQLDRPAVFNERDPLFARGDVDDEKVAHHYAPATVSMPADVGALTPRCQAPAACFASNRRGTAQSPKIIGPLPDRALSRLDRAAVAVTIPSRRGSAHRTQHRSPAPSRWREACGGDVSPPVDVLVMVVTEAPSLGRVCSSTGPPTPKVAGPVVVKRFLCGPCAVFEIVHRCGEKRGKIVPWGCEPDWPQCQYPSGQSPCVRPTGSPFRRRR
jgi:hypothetical protein